MNSQQLNALMLTDCMVKEKVLIYLAYPKTLCSVVFLSQDMLLHQFFPPRALSRSLILSLHLAQSVSSQLALGVGGMHRYRTYGRNETSVQYFFCFTTLWLYTKFTIVGICHQWYNLVSLFYQSVVQCIHYYGANQ